MLLFAQAAGHDEEVSLCFPALSFTLEISVLGVKSTVALYGQREYHQETGRGSRREITAAEQHSNVFDFPSRAEHHQLSH